MVYRMSDTMRELLERFRGRTEGAMLGLALERYRLATGAYPESLDALVPLYIETMPVDRVNGAPLQYQITDAGPAIYSVGEDRDDDGGRAPGTFTAVSFDSIDEWSQRTDTPRWGRRANGDQETPDGDWVLWPLHDPPLMPANARTLSPC